MPLNSMVSMAIGSRSLCFNAELNRISILLLGGSKEVHTCDNDSRKTC